MSVRDRTSVSQTMSSILLVLAISVAHLGTQIGDAFAGKATIDCCCGEHAADEACGCADCPAAVVARDRQRLLEARLDTDPEPAIPLMRSCSNQAERRIAPSPMIDWALPEGAATDNEPVRMMRWSAPTRAPAALFYPPAAPPS